MNNLSGITPVILAGGLGTRLHTTVPDRPKVLAEILGRPFLTFLLDQLTCAGASEVVLCTGYMGDMVREKLGDVYNSLSITYSREGKPLGTGGALRLALPRLKSEIVMVMNGDSYINADLNAFLEWFFEKDPAAALILTKVPDTSRYGRVVAAGDGRIKRFEEKGGNTGPGWINAGIYILKRLLVESIVPEIRFSLEREFFPEIVEKGLYGFPFSGEFIDIGTRESYLLAEEFFSKVGVGRQVS